VQRVELGPLLPPDLDQVREAGGRHERGALEAASCECYRGSREMYDRLLGPVGSRAASSNEARD
jgi:hypothetical protein